MEDRNSYTQYNIFKSPQLLLLLHSSKCTVQPPLRHLKITFYRLSEHENMEYNVNISLTNF